jgi:hypothetical protein
MMAKSPNAEGSKTSKNVWPKPASLNALLVAIRRVTRFHVHHRNDLRFGEG